MSAKRKAKSQPLHLLETAGHRLATRWGGLRKLGAGYFCLFFVLPPIPRTSVLCQQPRCPDFNLCRHAAGPSRLVYDRALDFAVRQLEHESRGK